MDLGDVKFGNSLPSEGYWEAEIRRYDTWESQKDSSKKGIKAVLSLVNNSHGREVNILAEAPVDINGLLAQMVMAATGFDMRLNLGEKLRDMLVEAIGKRVFVLIKHKRLGSKVYPNVVNVLSVSEFEAEFGVRQRKAEEAPVCPQVTAGNVEPMAETTLV
jgi:hypothetical protein